MAKSTKLTNAVQKIICKKTQDEKHPGTFYLPCGSRFGMFQPVEHSGQQQRQAVAYCLDVWCLAALGRQEIRNHSIEAGGASRFERQYIYENLSHKRFFVFVLGDHRIHEGKQPAGLLQPHFTRFGLSVV